MKSKILAMTAAIVLMVTFATEAVAQKDARVRVVNRSSSTVWTVHTSPTYADSYGSRDLLRGEVIPPGYNMVLDFNVREADNSCVQDVLARTRDGREWSKRINVCRESTWTLYD